MCQKPTRGSPCTPFYGCSQEPGDSHATICAGDFDGSSTCKPSCTSHADCQGATVTDLQSYNPQPQDNWCIDYGNVDLHGNSLGPACVRGLCFYDAAPPDSGLNAGALYGPCPGLPNSLCEPEYYATDTQEIGFCQSVQPSSGSSTVGQLCNPLAGRENPTAECGADAFCLGGICQPICDAVQPGVGNLPGCGSSLTCISPEGINLISKYQVGGCAVACDPYADAVNSGCTNFCGGPPSRCHFIFADGEQPGIAAGFCEAAVSAPIPAGQPCVLRPDGQETCESGAACFTTLPDAGGQTCLKLCLGRAHAGTPDACPGGAACSLLQTFTKTGVCP